MKKRNFPNYSVGLDSTLDAIREKDYKRGLEDAYNRLCRKVTASNFSEDEKYNQVLWDKIHASKETPPSVAEGSKQATEGEGSHLASLANIDAAGQVAQSRTASSIDGVHPEKPAHAALTPMTDAEQERLHDFRLPIGTKEIHLVRADFARQLERGLIHWRQRALGAEDELYQWSKWGVVEIAVRNASVSEYCRHWETRVEKLEIALAEAKNELLQFGVLPPTGKAIAKAMEWQNRADDAGYLARELLRIVKTESCPPT